MKVLVPGQMFFAASIRSQHSAPFCTVLPLLWWAVSKNQAVHEHQEAALSSLSRVQQITVWRYCSSRSPFWLQMCGAVSLCYGNHCICLQECSDSQVHTKPCFSESQEWHLGGWHKSHLQGDLSDLRQLQSDSAPANKNFLFRAIAKLSALKSMS